MKPLDRLILDMLDGKSRTELVLVEESGGNLTRRTVYERLSRLKDAGLVTTLLVRDPPPFVPPGYSATSEPPSRMLYYLTDAGKEVVK